MLVIYEIGPSISSVKLGQEEYLQVYFTFMMTDQCPMRLSPIFSWVKLGQEDSLQVLLYFYDDRSVSYEIESYI